MARAALERCGLGEGVDRKRAAGLVEREEHFNGEESEGKQESTGGVPKRKAGRWLVRRAGLDKLGQR